MLRQACTSLSSIQGRVKKRTVYFEHLPAHPCLPLAHTANGYKQMRVGSECMHRETHTETFKARCCRFETLIQTRSPLLLFHIVNKHTKLSPPLFVVSVGSVVPRLDPSFLRINLTLELTRVGVEERQRERESGRKLECHLLLLGISTGKATESATGHNGGPSEPQPWDRWQVWTLGPC